MTDETALTPYEAALAANNVYYTLSGWAAHKKDKTKKPKRSIEKLAEIKKQVTGSGKDSLKKANVKGKIQKTFEGDTIGARTGFGYVLTFKKQGRNHAVIALRGTRPEIGPPDLLTDLYFTPTGSVPGGLVHRGFAMTYDSFKDNIKGNDELARADTIHCVGHSLGGALANIVANTVKSAYRKDTKLYTFGAPRVGLHFGFTPNLERNLGISNIFRVSHTNDPITWIPTFPFLHAVGSDRDRNNMTLSSPAGPGSMKNHSMDIYSQKMNGRVWSDVRAQKYYPSFEDRLMRGIWESDSNGFLKGMKLIGAGAAWVLMKILRGLLNLLAGSVIMLVATPIDLICRLIYQGVQLASKIGKALMNWITAAAKWVGAKIKSAADVTVSFLKYLLERLLGAIRSNVIAALMALETAAMYYPAFVGPMAHGNMMFL
ncbi:MAG: lipase family protein [Woeseiaceae bacterium]|nr:lipase family protein [Woeseiaceae bacterium]